VELREASASSAKPIVSPHHRIGYLRVWSWAGEDTQETVLEAIARLNEQKVDSWILDLRGGWGGANPEFASVFYDKVAALRVVPRHGKASVRDTQLRGRAVVLIDGLTRSGKEIIAYSVKKAKAATLVGENTAGAVLAGRPFCLSDGSLLYLAVADVWVDGERLEGRGVAPDVRVPFDIAYSAGEDPQLTRAIGLVETAQ
jgi:carboxyl-terminal processing protease